MRFIGNKELIVSEIIDLFTECRLAGKGLTIFDAFCGTGAVSDALKDSVHVIANDLLRWCTVYTRGRICAPLCKFEKLGFDPFSFLNGNTLCEHGFIYKNYSPGGSKRMYFTSENAARIDYFRGTIEEWKLARLLNENEYSYLLASLIESVSTVSNTAGVYGAFLKHWDSRAKKPIQFKSVDFNAAKPGEAEFLNAKAEDLISEIECDVLYIDPPYTQNQYGTQYHLLETLVLNDNPDISPITGSRKTAPMRSDWSKQYKAHILLDRILASTKAKYVVFSYSEDGFISRRFIEACLKRYGKRDTLITKRISYRKYTNFKSRKKNDHYEYLFFVEKKEDAEIKYESPLNYIGGKARLIPHIKSHLPKNFTTFTDAFGGGFNVGVNIDAHRIIYNDINHFVCELISSFRITDTYQYILFLKRVVKKFGLKPADEKSYLRVRSYYNSLPPENRDPRLLFTVILYGFNQQIRFNGDHEFNNPVGMRWFNDNVLEKMISFSRILKEKNFVFESKDYKELSYEVERNAFMYLDPPYLLTNGAYNDGKRGFLGWDVETEARLCDFVDQINDEGKSFMISYVLEHNGQSNTSLRAWIRRRGYRIIKIGPVGGNKRNEVLITNY